MTREVILVILSLAGVIIAQNDCPPRGMNGSCTFSCILQICEAITNSPVKAYPPCMVVIWVYVIIYQCIAC